MMLLNTKITEEEKQELQEKAALVEALKEEKKSEILGRWLWVFFAAMPEKATREKLKEAGFQWAPKKKAWTWHTAAGSVGKHKPVDMETIRAKYSPLWEE